MEQTQDQAQEQAQEDQDTQHQELSNSEFSEALQSDVESQSKETKHDILKVQLEGYDPLDVPSEYIDKETGEFKIQSLVKAYKDTKAALSARAPEKYELEEVFTNNNLAWESDEQEKATVELFKKHRLSQDAVNDILTEYGSRYTKMMEVLGPQESEEDYNIRIQSEVQKLKTKWGVSAAENVQAVDKFAKEKFGEVATQVLQSADGYDMMLQLMKNTKGPNIIRDTEVAIIDLQSELGEVVANPHYNNPDSPNYKALHRRAEQLSQKISQSR